MTQSEFINIVKGMKAIYTDPKFIPDENAISVWYALFKDDHYDITQAAVQKHMMTRTTAPTPADIKGHIADLTAGHELNEEEAWNCVIGAVRNSSYYAEEEFAKLPATIQKAVASPANLRTMATMDRDELHTVEKSHFMRTYRQTVQRQKEMTQLPEAIRALIDATGRKMIGGAS